MSGASAAELAVALPAYEVGRELGHGAWGVVLEGRHRQLGREVAIKQLPSVVSADPEVRARFAAEARLLASLDHPHIVPVYDYVESGGLCLLVMEKLQGGTLWQRFTTVGVGQESACGIILAVLAGLHFAHERGILHRDIKPENLMFSGTGLVKVADFGIAKVVGGNDVMATKQGEVVGTPAYMAPEQAQGIDMGPWTDVYAVGCMLYELLSGRLPFLDEGEPLSLLYRHVFEDPPHLAEVAPSVPPGIAGVVMRSLVRPVEERYRTAEQFGVALAEAATATWGTSWPTVRGNVQVMAAGPILAATERPSMVGASAVPGAATPLAGEGQAAAAPRLTTAQAPVRRAPVELSEAEIVPVANLAPEKPATQVAAALILVVLTVLLAFAGLGTVAKGDAPRGWSVGGVAIAAGVPGAVDLDLAAPIPVQPPPGAVSVRLRISVLGIAVGQAKAGVGEPVDPANLKFFVPGRATSRWTAFDAKGREISTLVLPVKATTSAFLTVPFAVAALLLLTVLAYAESVLRSLRRGRKRASGPLALAVIGAAFGADAVLGSWVLGGKEPVVTSLALCAAVGAAAGIAAALAGIQAGKRRRFRPPKPAQA